MNVTKILIAVALITGPAFAQTAAAPTATTATYGDWTVNCTMATAATGDATPVKVCETTTRLNLKGKDGQLHPLLQIAIGQPPNAPAARVVLQLPIDVALRDPVALSLDKTPAADGQTSLPPQDDLLSASYLACAATGCLADAEVSGSLLARLQAAKTLNVTFSSRSGPRRITVPVSLNGFGDALADLGLAAK